MNVYLSGYLRGNFGDDLLFKIMCERYPDVHFYSYSDEKYDGLCKQVPNLTINSPKYARKSKFAGRLLRVFDILKNSARCNAIVNLGGSIFIHTPSNHTLLTHFKDLVYSLYRKLLLISYKNNFVVGSNFGPYGSDKTYKRINDYYFSRCRDVCFRDNESFRLFENIKSCRQSTDLAFTLNHENIGKTGSQKVFVSVVDLLQVDGFSFTREDQSAYELQIVSTLRRLAETSTDIVISGFCQYQGDHAVAKRICERLHEYSVPATLLNYDSNVDAIIDSISQSKYVIGTRFHSVVLGIQFGCVTLPVLYSNKTRNLLNDMNFPSHQIIDARGGMQKLSDAVQDAERFNLSRSYKEFAEEQFRGLDSYFKEQL